MRPARPHGPAGRAARDSALRVGATGRGALICAVPYRLSRWALSVPANAFTSRRGLSGKPGLVKPGGQPMAQFKEATLTTGGKIIVNVDEIRLMHWIQDATTIRFAKDHGVQIKETPEHLMMSKTLRNM
jgi:hypothetical protein